MSIEGIPNEVISAKKEAPARLIIRSVAAKYFWHVVDIRMDAYIGRCIIVGMQLLHHLSVVNISRDIDKVKIFSILDRWYQFDKCFINCSSTTTSPYHENDL